MLDYEKHRCLITYEGNVATGEAGGITVIGAYQVKMDDGRLITF
jgi:translation initiation factor IF-2